VIGLPGKHCGVLTDASGFVLETPRDPRTIDFGQLIHWSEAGIGRRRISEQTPSVPSLVEQASRPPFKAFYAAFRRPGLNATGSGFGQIMCD